MLKKFAFIVWGIVGVIVVVVVLGSSESDQQRNTELASTTSPQRYAELIIGSKEANVEVTANKGAYTIQYNLAPWSLTNGTTRMMMFSFIKRLVPQFFSKFSDAASVEVIAVGPFKDIRGNESIDKVSDATFSRTNASTIQFDNVSSDNIPQIADEYWEHPSLQK